MKNRNNKKTSSTPKSILLPVDFSDHSERTFKEAVKLAKTFGANLTVLHVLETTPTLDYGIEAQRKLQAAKENAEERLKKLTSNSPEARKTVARQFVRVGRAYPEILKVAEGMRPDWIIVGTHSHNDLKHALLGSTAQRVVEHANSPVLVIR
jgi:universal stress protein A